ncbi:MAG TPA: hypothetical protein VG013_24870, partial [Gemmataceae bacterium]|nr:hypothetical protein [Gemmataceae bacterium]
DSGPKRLLLRPPFEFGPVWKAETLVNWFWLTGVFVISVLLLTDFFNLTYEGDKTVWRLLLPLHLGGVTPRHSGHDVGATVFGLWQPWLYVVFLAYKASVLYRVARNTHRYQTMLANKHAARSLAPPQQPAVQSSETASAPGREDMKAGRREGDAKGGRQEGGGEEA